MAVHDLLPPPPQTQALSSKTFRLPPLDGSLNVPEVYDWHLENSPNHPFFVYAQDNGNVKTIYWPEAVRAIHVAAKEIRQRMGWKPNQGQAPVIGILSGSETISYHTILVGIMRAGYVPFPISPRNSAAAVAHLINKAGVKHILVGHDQFMKDLTNEALEILRSSYQSTPEPATSPYMLFDELYLAGEAVDIADIPYEHRSLDAPALVLHSSGSTAFPKPIYRVQRTVSQALLIPFFGERDMTGQILAQHTLPMYHGMGSSQVMWIASVGIVIGVFEPKFPPHIPTPETVFKAAHDTNSDIIVAIPAFVEAWSRNPSYIEWLSKRAGVMYGGGPINKAAGDLMASKGVSLYNTYGTTECGMMSLFLPAKADSDDWDYLKFPDFTGTHFVPRGDNKFELVIETSPFRAPCVFNTKINGNDAYGTSDLFTPHPSKPGYYKMFGRADDQIMHSTGEKTNPGPLETILNQDPHISSAIIFGRGRFQAGVLINPKPEAWFDSSDEEKLAEFRNKIWPTVQKMNAYAPQHSRIFKEMIITAKSTKPFEYTAKGTPRRQVAIDNYADEIDKLYEAVNESTQSIIPPPAYWDVHSTTGFVRAVVRKVMTRDVKDDDDVFQNGCDSLQSTWIRNSILRAIRDSLHLETREIIENFVYDHPTINRLSTYVIGIASGTSDNDSSHANAMQTMVDKYSHNFPIHQTSNAPAPKGYTVLMTGSTGGLGCYILAQLASDPEILRVYALNRSNREGKPLLERQRAALNDRGHDASLLDSEKVVLLEGDTSAHNFGLSDSVYNEMRDSVTHVLHNAWPVDFNFSLTSYEPSIKGVRNLIDFCLSSPRSEPSRFIYISSIGLFKNLQGFPPGEPLPERHVDATVAVGNGYPESKWVSEEIIAAAVAQTQCRSLIIRVGQLCGGPNGAWNATDWFPAIVQSAEIVKCLPDDDKVVSWIQSDIAAKAVIDLCKAQNETGLVHLVHPKPARYSALGCAIASELSVPLVPYTEWFSKLEQAGVVPAHLADDGRVEVGLHKKITALRLLPFYRQIASRTVDKVTSNAFGSPQVAVARAVAGSSTLGDSQLETLGDEHVKRWLGYWRRVGSLNQ